MSVNHVEPRPRKPALQAWAPVAIGAVLAATGVQLVREHLLFDTEAAALGQLTSSIFGEVKGARVHCLDMRDAVQCLTAYQAAGSPPAVLWLGNSQLHGVNRLRPGDKTAPMVAHEDLAARGQYVVTYSQPNANLLEHRHLFKRLRQDYDIQTLLLSVCLDDFRESGIRSELSPPQAEIRPPEASSPKVAFSPQPVVEDFLETTLSDRLSVWRDREGLKGLAQYATYVIRNRAFGINAQTKRPVSQAQYDEKIAVLKDILAQARAANIKVVLYVPAYRTDVPGPYVEAQYASLLADLQAMTIPGQVSFIDATNSVPGPEWGMLKDSLFGFNDYDFMHFTSEGHRRLAGAVIGAL